ncbi:MAG: hypothetical protein ABEK50_11680 [bacterium]
MADSIEFMARTFDATVTSSDDEINHRILLEGITTTIGSTGMGVQGKTPTRVPPEEVLSWKGSKVYVRLYTAGRDLKNAHGTIQDISDAPESRYRWFFAIRFKKPIRLSSLRVNRRKNE